MHIEIGLAVITLMAAFFYIKLYKHTKQLKLDLNISIEARTKLMFQKKQSEIVTGQVAEKLAPFLKDFKHDPQNIQFLGNPIDFIAFEEKGITLIEIKSANSRLTQKQKDIKNQVKNKKIFWEEFRIK
jgi:predicted Holliday junction resolvase-like endonuclease